MNYKTHANLLFLTPERRYFFVFDSTLDFVKMCQMLTQITLPVENGIPLLVLPEALEPDIMNMILSNTASKPKISYGKLNSLCNTTANEGSPTTLAYPLPQNPAQPASVAKVPDSDSDDSVDLARQNRKRLTTTKNNTTTEQQERAVTDNLTSNRPRLLRKSFANISASKLNIQEANQETIGYNAEVPTVSKMQPSGPSAIKLINFSKHASKASNGIDSLKSILSTVGSSDLTKMSQFQAESNTPQPLKRRFSMKKSPSVNLLRPRMDSSIQASEHADDGSIMVLDHDSDLASNIKQEFTIDTTKRTTCMSNRLPKSVLDPGLNNSEANSPLKPNLIMNSSTSRVDSSRPIILGVGPRILRPTANNYSSAADKATTAALQMNSYASGKLPRPGLRLPIASNRFPQPGSTYTSKIAQIAVGEAEHD